MDLLTRLRAQPLPFAALLGIDLISAEPEKIVGEMTVRPEFCTRPAVLHGGAIMAFADTLGALATVANLKDGAGTTTIESKTNFIGAATVGSRVVGETTPVHRGGRTMVWQTRYDDRGEARCGRDANAASSMTLLLKLVHEPPQASSTDWFLEPRTKSSRAFADFNLASSPDERSEIRDI